MYLKTGAKKRQKSYAEVDQKLTSDLNARATPAKNWPLSHSQELRKRRNGRSFFSK